MRVGDINLGPGPGLKQYLHRVHIPCPCGIYQRALPSPVEMIDPGASAQQSLLNAQRQQAQLMGQRLLVSVFVVNDMVHPAPASS